MLTLVFCRAIEALPTALQRLVAYVEEETGYPIVILWGGPQVKDHGTVMTWQFVQCSFVQKFIC